MNQNVFKLTLPILFGYLPLGMAFGVLFTTQLDYAWWVAPLMGLLIYAGAGQILAVSLLSVNAGLVEVAVAMLVLNARHLFYGLSLLGQFRGAGWRKGYLIFGLTDETYSLLTSRPRSSDRHHEQEVDFRITGFNQIYWVLGCTLGALLGEWVAFNSTGIEFALVALFIVLTIEQFKVLRNGFPIWAGALAAGVAMLLIPATHQLIAAIALVTGVLLLHYRCHRQTTLQPETNHD
ncbi:AzlC family ABC transporter permease [Marinobacter sp.]|uniref:AzlC family ABC transporter permease n=1 Tax=Marinobacter sp. TaxID=50741 RepID=UPI003563A51E